MTPEVRLVLLHKQRTSGRVRFLCQPSGIVAFTPLPPLAALRDEDWSPTVQVHPTAVMREAEIKLGLPEEAIEPEAEFAAWVDTPEGDIPVLLGSFTTIDPPFEAAECIGARFIAITESRHLTEVERGLLRRAYEQVLG